MPFHRLRGLIAATYTPLDAAGGLRLEVVGPMVERLLAEGVRGFYVCGSTGEGMSLTTAERQAVAAEFVRCVAGRGSVVIQVGHNSLEEAVCLSRHAGEIGADAISATCPSYFPIDDPGVLIESMGCVAGACDLPFYYYHIPALTGSAIDIVDFLPRASETIPTLVGLKYTDTKLFEYQQCVDLDGGRLDVLWGCDEMLLGALATGATGAIGSTYNLAARLNARLIDAFEQGDLTAARRLQLNSIQLIRTLGQFPFHPAMKVALALLGDHVGPCRLPQPAMTAEMQTQLTKGLEAIAWRSLVAGGDQENWAGPPE